MLTIQTTKLATCDYCGQQIPMEPRNNNTCYTVTTIHPRQGKSYQTATYVTINQKQVAELVERESVFCSWQCVISELSKPPLEEKKPGDKGFMIPGMGAFGSSSF